MLQTAQKAQWPGQFGQWRQSLEWAGSCSYSCNIHSKFIQRFKIVNCYPSVIASQDAVFQVDFLLKILLDGKETFTQEVLLVFKLYWFLLIDFSKSTSVGVISRELSETSTSPWASRASLVHLSLHRTGILRPLRSPIQNDKHVSSFTLWYLLASSTVCLSLFFTC